MSEIGTARRGSLLELFYGVYRRDANAVIAALIDLGIIVPTADAISLRRAIGFGLDNLLRKVRSQRIAFPRMELCSHRPGHHCHHGGGYLFEKYHWL